jgi:hypothetical protein
MREADDAQDDRLAPFGILLTKPRMFLPVELLGRTLPLILELSTSPIS